MPATGPQRADEPRDTRVRILHAALDLFSTHGYTATSMRQLARAVGVRESAIYAHFKGKQDILDTLFSQYGPGAAAERILRIDREELLRDTREVLRGLVAFGVEQWTSPEEIKLFRLGMTEHILGKADASLPAPQKAIEDVMRRMKDLFSLLVSERVLQDDDPEFLLAQFMGPLFFMRQECTLFRLSPESIGRLRAFCSRHVDYFLEKTMRTKENT